MDYTRKVGKSVKKENACNVKKWHRKAESRTTMQRCKHTGGVEWGISGSLRLGGNDSLGIGLLCELGGTSVGGVDATKRCRNQVLGETREVWKSSNVSKEESR